MAWCAAADAQHHPRRNVVTRVLGGGASDVEPDVWLLPVSPGDRMLVCSDGLTDELSDARIEAELRAEDEAQAAADRLVAAALAAGGHDNVTAIVLDATLSRALTADARRLSRCALLVRTPSTVRMPSAVHTEREAPPARGGHLLVQDQDADEELERRGDVLEQPEHGQGQPPCGGVEEQQRDGGHDAGRREDQGVRGALGLERPLPDRRSSRPGTPSATGARTRVSTASPGTAPTVRPTRFLMRP